MEVRDPIHGAIDIRDAEIPILDNLFFQRLRNLKQLGFAELSFPGATHNRYIHSIGVMHVATRAFDTIFEKSPFSSERIKDRFRTTVRLAAFLHDIGHGPFSHSTEAGMPSVDELDLTFAGKKIQGRQADHEDYTLKILLSESMRESFQIINDTWGTTVEDVASLIAGVPDNPEVFKDGGTDWFPVLRQLVSSEIDADRMDYLLRDSYYCGVNYGKYDFDWLISNLSFAIVDDSAHLSISNRAIYSFDDFLLSRYHMFLMVYYHHKSVIHEEMLRKYFADSFGQNHNPIPASLEEYLHCDDASVFERLRKSENSWAHRVVNRRPYKMIFESRIELEGEESEVKVEKIKSMLKEEGVDFIYNTSTGALSKYYLPGTEPKGFRIYVQPAHGRKVLPLEEVTDLFRKYSAKRSISRIYADHDAFGTAPGLKRAIEEMH